MTFYRGNVYRVYTAAVASASKAASAYSQVENIGWGGDDSEEAAADFNEAFREFEDALDALKETLPESVFSKGGLARHAFWCRHWIDKNRPLSCGSDPHEILERDLPAVIVGFERWYRRQSKIDEVFTQRMAPFGKSELINSSIREAWTVFKTEIVDILDLPNNLDGVPLVRQMFGDSGALTDVMSEKERRAYCHLLTGLYALCRNPVMHNDVKPNPAEAEIVTTLLGRCLAEVRTAIRTGQDANSPKSTA